MIYFILFFFYRKQTTFIFHTTSIIGFWKFQKFDFEVGTKYFNSIKQIWNNAFNIHSTINLFSRDNISVLCFFFLFLLLILVFFFCIYRCSSCSFASNHNDFFFFYLITFIDRIVFSHDINLGNSLSGSRLDYFFITSITSATILLERKLVYFIYIFFFENDLLEGTSTLCLTIY